MTATIAMGLSVLIWSLYPLAAAIGLETMSGLELVVMVHFVAAAGSALLCFHYLWIQKQFKTFLALQKQLDKRGIILIIASAVTSVACHGLFFSALMLSHKGGVSLIYETWPIIAVVATQFLMRKKWQPVGLSDFLIGLVSLVGIAIIIYSSEDFEISLTNSDLTSDAAFDWLSLMGYVLAFVGAYCCALNIATKAAVTEYFTSMNDDMATTFISEVYSRVIAVIILIAALPLYSQYFDYSNIHIGSSLFVGFVVMILGGALYTIALLKTDRITIHIVYYLVPILAVIWLWLLGQTTLNYGLFIGGGLIVLCNIYLALAARKDRVS